MTMSIEWFAVWGFIVTALLRLWIEIRTTKALRKQITAQQTVIRRQGEVVTALRSVIADAATGKRDSDKVLDEEFIEG